MTTGQLAQRVHELERQVAQLRRERRPLAPLANIQDTFGMFAENAKIGEVMRLGRGYREQANSEEE